MVKKKEQFELGEIQKTGQQEAEQLIRQLNEQAEKRTGLSKITDRSPPSQVVLSLYDALTKSIIDLSVKQQLLEHKYNLKQTTQTLSQSSLRDAKQIAIKNCLQELSEQCKKIEEELFLDKRGELSKARNKVIEARLDVSRIVNNRKEQLTALKKAEASFSNLLAEQQETFAKKSLSLTKEDVQKKAGDYIESVFQLEKNLKNPSTVLGKKITTKDYSLLARAQKILKNFLNKLTPHATQTMDNTVRNMQEHVGLFAKKHDIQVKQFLTNRLRLGK